MYPIINLHSPKLEARVQKVAREIAPDMLKIANMLLEAHGLPEIHRRQRVWVEAAIVGGIRGAFKVVAQEEKEDAKRNGR
jgi:hypothetical protein